MKAPVKEKSKYRIDKPGGGGQSSKTKRFASEPRVRFDNRGNQEADRGPRPDGHRQRVASYSEPKSYTGHERSNPSQRNWLFGRREVIELLRSDLKTQEILILRGGEGNTFDEILELSEARGVPIRLAERREFDNLFPDEIHQGAAAAFYPGPPVEFDDLISNGGPSLLVMLDGVMDPHNLGAVIRSAEVFGAKGVIIPERRAAGMTPAAIKTSAGAALRIPTVQAGNLANAIRKLKEAGFWIYGLDPDAKSSLWEEEFSERVCVVFGSEGNGLARLTRDLCDHLIKIPQIGRIGSLNISASAAIVLAELSRKCENSGKKVDL